MADLEVRGREEGERRLGVGFGICSCGFLVWELWGAGVGGYSKVHEVFRKQV